MNLVPVKSMIETIQQKQVFLWQSQYSVTDTRGAHAFCSLFQSSFFTVCPFPSEEQVPENPCRCNTLLSVMEGVLQVIMCPLYSFFVILLNIS